MGAVSPSINKQLLAQRLPSAPIAVDFRTMLEYFSLSMLRMEWLHPLTHDIIGVVLTEQTEKVALNNTTRVVNYANNSESYKAFK